MSLSRGLVEVRLHRVRCCMGQIGLFHFVVAVLHLTMLICSGEPYPGEQQSVVFASLKV